MRLNGDMMGIPTDKPPMTGNGNHTTYKNGDLGEPLWSKLSRSVVVSHRYLSGCQLDRDIQPWTNSTIWLRNQMGMG